MEQYLMWMEAKHGVDFGYSRIQAKSSSSWEERAFAEDLRGGPLGGFVWPPRSYTCTFCRREFRSAQALGGHMNVHRRDRARLKQSLIINQNGIDLDHYQVTKKNTDLSHKYSMEKSSLDSGSNCGRPSFLLGLNDEYYVETNLCVGRGGAEEESSMVNFKRRKQASGFKKLDFGLNPLWSNDSIGGVDLELRLGGSPRTDARSPKVGF